MDYFEIEWIQSYLASTNDKQEKLRLNHKTQNIFWSIGMHKHSRYTQFGQSVGCDLQHTTLERNLTSGFLDLII